MSSSFKSQCKCNNKQPRYANGFPVSGAGERRESARATEEFDDRGLVAEDDKELEKVKEYLLAVEKLEMSMNFLDAHFGGVGSPRGLRER